jgi:tRNA (guanine-N7-)-methyltransferase
MTTEQLAPARPPNPPPTLVFRPASYMERLPLAEMFPVAQPLEVELGSGDGSFMAKYAAANPGTNFIGVERLLGRLRKLDRKGLRLGLKNLRLMRLEALYFVEYMLPKETAQALHLYFPDPWPKRKHHKNRLVNEQFAKAVSQALTRGGVAYLRTDNAEYFEQMLTVFGGNADFEKIETPDTLAAVITDFERGFNAQGIGTRRAAFRKMSNDECRVSNVESGGTAAGRSNA